MSDLEGQFFVTFLCGAAQLVGGVYLGLGIKQLLARQPHAFAGIGLGMFWGGVPTLMSALFLFNSNRGLFALGVALWLGVALLRVIVPDGLIASIGSGTIVAVVIGLAVTPVGVLVLIESIRRNQEVLFGILFGGCWSFVGFGFLSAGLGALLRGKPLHLRPDGRGGNTLVSTDELDAEDSAPKPKRKKKVKNQG